MLRGVRGVYAVIVLRGVNPPSYSSMIGPNCLPIGAEGTTSSEPYMVGVMLEPLLGLGVTLELRVCGVDGVKLGVLKLYGVDESS